MSISNYPSQYNFRTWRIYYIITFISIYTKYFLSTMLKIWIKILRIREVFKKKIKF